VSRCLAALEFGLKKLRSGFPICMRLLRDMHKVLMMHPRGSGKTPGEILRSQVWLGGTVPETPRSCHRPSMRCRMRSNTSSDSSTTSPSLYLR
jgi:hypothetical protein